MYNKMYNKIENNLIKYNSKYIKCRHQSTIT